jgi:pre-mRNA-splicing factor CDC5/CEF1
MLDEEIQYLRVPMGHENDFFEDFVKSHDALPSGPYVFPNE